MTNDSVELSFFSNAVLRRWYLPVGLALVGMLIGFVVRPPAVTNMTEASTRVLIRPVTDAVLNSNIRIDQVINEDTEAEIATSDIVAQAAIELLGDEVPVGLDIDEIDENLTVNVIPDSQIVVLKYTDEDADVAAAVVDSIAAAYLDARTTAAVAERDRQAALLASAIAENTRDLTSANLVIETAEREATDRAQLQERIGRLEEVVAVGQITGNDDEATGDPIAALQTELDSLPDTVTPAQLASARTSQSLIGGQIAELRDTLVGLSTLEIDGGVVLEQARPGEAVTNGSGLIIVAIAAFFGLLLGFVLAVALERSLAVRSINDSRHAPAGGGAAAPEPFPTFDPDNLALPTETIVLGQPDVPPAPMAPPPSTPPTPPAFVFDDAEAQPHFAEPAPFAPGPNEVAPRVAMPGPAPASPMPAGATAVLDHVETVEPITEPELAPEIVETAPEPETFEIVTGFPESTLSPTHIADEPVEFVEAEAPATTTMGVPIAEPRLEDPPPLSSMHPIVDPEPAPDAVEVPSAVRVADPAPIDTAEPTETVGPTDTSEPIATTEPTASVTPVPMHEPLAAPDPEPARPHHAPETTGGLTVLVDIPKIGRSVREPVVATEPDSEPAAALRTLARAVVDGCNGLSTPSVMVASARPDEGRTTVASNMATALRLDGLDVILVTDDHASVIVPGVHVLPRGMRVGPDGEFPPSDRLRDLLDEARQLVDIVIIDGPPVLTDADGIRVAAECDRAVLVGISGRTTTADVDSSARIIEESGTPVLGLATTVRPGWIARRLGDRSVG